ncbi:hypothetical protein V2E29_04040 [Streptomyces diastatochromogenes]|uniref:hypothetical protein n=1 Tax=Streptomyces diastatochromogenes TaxID=42236 RepID=UPI002F26096B
MRSQVKLRRPVTVASAASAAVTVWHGGPLAGTAQAADEDLGSLAEEYAYPDRDELLAENGLKLLSGDADITLTDCTADNDLVQIRSRRVRATDTTAVARSSGVDAARACGCTGPTGVYDDAAETSQQFVDGKARTVAAFTTPWQAPGALQIGRLFHKGAWQEHFAGTIDGLRLRGRTVGAENIANEGFRVKK